MGKSFVYNAGSSKENLLEDESQFTFGVFIDGFNDEWWIESEGLLELVEKKFVVFVSPELHHRRKEQAWEFFKNLQSKNIATFGVCTDHPLELKNLFYG